jgi:two-component system sensor histidine kinase ComP
LLDEAGLVAALEHYLDLIQQRSGIEIHLEVGPEVSGNSPAVSIVAFRVVQEAVNNALKHSGASRIEVSLQAENEDLCLLISDNGSGFDPSEVRQRVQRGEHLGLLGMGERVDAVGGTFEIDSTPGQGSRITARIPR